MSLTECETKLSYLDILVTIENGKYYNFTIVYLSSNIPSGPAYGVYVSQLVCIGRICSDYSQFTMRHYKLTEHQGFRYSALCVAFCKFAKKHTRCSVRRWCVFTGSGWILESPCLA